MRGTRDVPCPLTFLSECIWTVNEPGSASTGYFRGWLEPVPRTHLPGYDDTTWSDTTWSDDDSSRTELFSASTCSGSRE